MVDLPRPTVEVVTTADSVEHVVISRELGKATTYEIPATGTTSEKIATVVKSVIDDHRTAEWLP